MSGSECNICTHLVAKVIRISHGEFHGNRPGNGARYSRLCESHFLAHIVYMSQM